LAGVVRDAVFLGDLGGGVLVAADERGDLHLRNALECVEMLLAERTLAGDPDFHRLLLRTAALAPAAARLSLLLAAARFGLAAPRLLFSRMMCPTAVFDAGTV